MSYLAVAAVVIQPLIIVPDCSSLFLIWVVQNVSWPGAINSGDGAIDSSSNPFQRQECPRQLLTASTWMMGAPWRPSLTFSHSRSVSVALIGHSQPLTNQHITPHLTWLLTGWQNGTLMEPHVHADGASFVFPFIWAAIVSRRIRVENSFTRWIKFENYAQLGRFFPISQRLVFDQNCLLNSWKLFIGQEAIETSFHFNYP